MRTTATDLPEIQEAYRVWTERVVALHPGTIGVRNERVYLTRLRRPLTECQVALLSTAGVHRVDQPPFDSANEMGDGSYRLIPDHSPSSMLTVAHGHYDQGAAEADINCIFPIDRLRELAQASAIGAVGPTHVGMMGYLPDPREWLKTSVPAAIEQLRKDGNDAVLITPG